MIKKKLGIVGGMGSVAAAHTFQRITEMTPAEKDQDYIEIIIHNNSLVPDRTNGILFGGESPIYELQRSVSLLNKADVDYIIFACITSHYFIPKLRSESKAILIDAVAETAKYINFSMNNIKNVGIIASTGAVRIGLFQKALERFGLHGITLTPENQETYFTEPIYAPWGVKAGNCFGKSAERLVKAAEILIESGAEAIILGCSELPLVFNKRKADVPLIDAIDVMLKTSINFCLGKTVVPISEFPARADVS
jgi:aspartate racemase